MKASTSATIMMMKAVVQNKFGAPETVLSLSSQVPKPIIKDPNHILIRVHASSVNTPDWSHTKGIPYIIRPIFGYVFSSPKDKVIGTDVAGVVEDVGSAVTHVKKGDEVFGSTSDGMMGAFAEYALAPSSSIILKPKEVSFEQAAGAVMSGLTAVAVMHEGAKVHSGMNVLINGASGGVGTYCIQLAKARGATVTAVCSGKNSALVKSLGADHFIDYTKEDYTEMGAKYDVIVDNVMNRSFKESAKALSSPTKGIIVPNSMGTDRSKWFGAIPSFIFKPSRYPAVESKTTHTTLQEIADLLVSGKMKVIIDKVYALDETPQAVAYMASRRARGQVVIKVV
jgi:NADPH:quinone reductase-like Zn-dependent oxidoreductase